MHFLKIYEHAALIVTVFAGVGQFYGKLYQLFFQLKPTSSELDTIL